MTSATDVRAWLVDNAEKLDGAEIPGKGRIPKHLQEVYDAAHPGGNEAGGADMDVAPGPAYDGGVTEADFPAAPESGEPRAPGTAGPDHERKPRRVTAARKQQAKSFRQRIWGGGGTKRPAKKHPRISVKGLIEDTWMDAAWTFQGLPPIEKILYLQAPLAGQLLEDTVRDTAVDKFLQPVARADRTFKAFESLTAPLWVGLIMVKGRRSEETGEYSPETKLMFGGLRHSLLAMTRAVDLDFTEMKVRSEELKGKSAVIDEMIAWLFEMPEPSPEQAAAMAGQAA